MARKRKPVTNITTEHERLFETVQNPEPGRLALFSCFVNGEPTAALVRIRMLNDEQVGVEPLFVAITEGMELTDHDGVEALL